MFWFQIKSIFPSINEKFKLDEKISKNTVFSLWENTVLSVCGCEFVNKSQPFDFRDDVLYVECLDSIWVGEFRVRQNDLLGELNNNFNGKKGVKNIQFSF